MYLTPWQRVRRFAQWAGVTVRSVQRIPWQNEAPFCDNLGISWDGLVLFVEDGTERRPLTVGNAIHELGHLLATRERPGPSEELDFCGWEWRVALRCGVSYPWWGGYGMRHYGTDTGEEYGDMGGRERWAFLLRMLKRGKAVGNVSPSGRPLMLRGPRAEVTHARR